MNKRTNHRALLNHALKQVKAGPKDNMGICSLVAMQLRLDGVPSHERISTSILLSRMLPEWPEGTRNDCFPVPGIVFSKSPSTARWAYDNKPKWRGLYGRRRKALLNWLIQQTEGVAADVS